MIHRYDFMENLQFDTQYESKNTQKKISNTGKFLIAASGGVGIGLSIICFPFVAPALRKICLPYVPATDAQLKNVMCALKDCSGKMLDVGSGDGRIVVEAARNNFIAHGVELNPWLVQYSRLNAIINKVNSKTSFYRRDLWKFDLKPYSAIVIFGVEEMMPKFEDKLMCEANHNTSVVACRFPLNNLKPEKTIGEGVDTVWYYKIKK